MVLIALRAMGVSANRRRFTGEGLGMTPARNSVGAPGVNMEGNGTVRRADSVDVVELAFRPAAASLARVERRFSAAFPPVKYEMGFSPCRADCHIVVPLRRTSPRRRSAPRKLSCMFIGFCLEIEKRSRGSADSLKGHAFRRAVKTFP